MKPNVIPLTPWGHFVPQLYHKAAWGVSSLKTSSVVSDAFLNPVDLFSRALQLKACYEYQIRKNTN